MNDIDQRNVFDEDIFSYRVSKEGKVFIAWHGKQVMVLQGKSAQKIVGQSAGGRAARGAASAGESDGQL